MQVKQAHGHNPHAHAPRPLRAERRQLERESGRRHNRGSNRGLGRFSLLAGLGVMVLAMGLFGYLALRQTVGSSSAQSPVPRAASPLVDRQALDPAISLLKVGSTAPNFTVRNITGDPVTLKSQRGHPVLLEFFAAWCPVCHAEAPIVHRLMTNYANKGLSTLAVLANPYGRNSEISRGNDLTIADKGDLTWYSTTYKANYPLLVDKTFSAVNRYGAGSYPTLYVIDARGKVAFAHQGALPYRKLAQTFDRLIAAGK
jgi:peroxiredoxin